MPLTCLLVIWPGDRPIEKVFTSLRVVLWSKVLNNLLDPPPKHSLVMVDSDINRTFLEIVDKLNLSIDEKEQQFLELSSNEQQNDIEKRLIDSGLANRDSDNRLMIDITHANDDSLLKASNDSTVRLPEDIRLFDKLYTFGQMLNKCEGDFQIVHICDLQSQYQCELFVLLSKIVYPNCTQIKQCLLPLAPAVIDDDRPSTKYDELSVDNYINELVVKIAIERESISTANLIPTAVFKLQLMCRKQHSLLHLRSNIETNHDAVFLLYMGARLASILNSFDEKHHTGYYPPRELFNDQLVNMLTIKEEQEFLNWIQSFDSRLLVICLNDSNKVLLNFDKIFQEIILFCRRLSPYYSKVRILTENQVHLLSTMFARLELVERIVVLLRRILSLIAIPLIERM